MNFGQMASYAWMRQAFVIYQNMELWINIRVHHAVSVQGLGHFQHTMEIVVVFA